MSESRRRRRSSRPPPLLILVLVAVSISLQTIPGLCEDPSTPKNEVKSESSSSSRKSKGLTILFACLGVAAFVLLSVFLFKMWQKKKREQQHARLLKLFEQDDELEVELGLRD